MIVRGGIVGWDPIVNDGIDVDNVGGTMQQQQQQQQRRGWVGWIAEEGRRHASRHSVFHLLQPCTMKTTTGIT